MELKCLIEFALLYGKIIIIKLKIFLLLLFFYFTTMILSKIMKAYSVFNNPTNFLSVKLIIYEFV